MANNSGWQAPPASQCVSPQSCTDPAPPAKPTLGKYCHQCGGVECTDSNIFSNFGVHCTDIGFTPVSCPNGVAPGAVPDCCSFACSVDAPPAPAACSGP